MLDLKHWREKKGYSQKFVAISVGVAAPQISKWEAGVTEPTLTNLIKLADLYDVSLDVLCGHTRQVDYAVSTYDEAILVQVFRQLTDIGQTAVLTTAKALLEQPGMRKDAAIPSAM